MIKLTREMFEELPWDRRISTSFVEGKLATNIKNELDKTLKGISFYDIENGVLRGSSFPIAALIDTAVRPYGFRTANLRDLSRPEIMNRVKGKFYTDAPVLILRSLKDSYENNLPLIKQISELAEQKLGRLELPLMVTGINVVPWKKDTKGYGFKIVPRDDFKVITDKRLSSKYNCKRFTDVDDIGLPIFNSNGTRTWYLKQEGLSSLCLYGDLGVYSDVVDLAVTGGGGRVVLVSDEVSAKNFKA